MLDFPNEAYARAVIQVCRGYRKTDLLDETGYPPQFEVEPDRVVVYARTGLYTAATGLLFLAAILLAPIAGVIPGAATSPALVLIGMLMIHNATNIYWHQVEIALHSFLMIVGMPFTFSITTGVMLGVVSYAVVMVCRRRAHLVDPALCLLAAVFVLNAVLGTLS